MVNRSVGVQFFTIIFFIFAKRANELSFIFILFGLDIFFLEKLSPLVRFTASVELYRETHI